MAKHPPFLATIIHKIENVENLSFQQATIIHKIENVENLSFQHFQQVFNTKVHNKISHNDEHSTIQQVFNKTFNNILKQKITQQR